MKIIHVAAIVVAVIIVLLLAKFGFNSDESVVEPTTSEESQVMVGEDSPQSDTADATHSELARYERLLDSNQLNNDEKVEYARLKIEHAHSNQDVMAGVQTLLGVIRSDSNHVKALESLAELSIQSGQLEKARERYQKLLTLQPQNEGYRRMLQELNRRIGG